MKAATSPARSTSASTAASAGMTATEPEISSGSPAVSGVSKGGSAPRAAWSCQPWKCPASFTILLRPVTARASRRASSDASVPLEVNRTRSAEGTRRITASAQSLSSSWQAPGWNDLAAWSRTAATTSGWPCPASNDPWPIT
jgi:hypothetical protein